MSAATDARAALAAMLAEHGQTMTLRRVAPGAYDATSGSTAAATTTNYTGKGRLGNYRDALITGTLIKQGDRRCTFQPDSWSNVPAANDRLVVGSAVYEIINVQARELAGTVFEYTLQVRGPTVA